MHKKLALIIGVNSQDGSYMADYLYSRGYHIYGTSRDIISIERKWHKDTNVDLIQLNLFQFEQISNIINSIMPDEIYNFTALTSGSDMYSRIDEIHHINGIFVSYILESIRKNKKRIRFFQSSSREIFGIPKQYPQNENTLTSPRSPYGAAKLFSQNLTKIYREHYNLFAVSGILYNHESERRGDSFVSKKISKAAARIKFNLQTELILGDIDASRDWGFAGDFVEAIFLIMQNYQPEDYIIATGNEYKVRDFCYEAFDYLGLNYLDHIVIDKKLARRGEEKAHFIGDISKIRHDTGWEPKKKFNKMVQEMVENEIKNLEKNNEI